VAVGVDQGISDVNHVAKQLITPERSPGQTLRKLPLEEVPSPGMHAVVFADVVQDADVTMSQDRHAPGTAEDVCHASFH
jgi:hypothetical protein